MKAPYISLENAPEVTEYFLQAMPNFAITRAIHFLSGRKLKAVSGYDRGAKQQISKDLSEGRQLLIAHNHQSNWDPFVLASILQREKMFRQMRNKTVIPGKPVLFNNPYYGWAVRRSGAVPVFRTQDFEGVDDPEVEARRLQANNSLIDILISKMNDGLHGAIYPEGTRSIKKKMRGEAVDFTKLQHLHDGIGRIACGVDDPENVRIVCVGTAYGFHHNDYSRPVSIISRPFPVAETPAEVVDQTRETLQYTLTAAHMTAGILR